MIFSTNHKDIGTYIYFLVHFVELWYDIIRNYRIQLVVPVILLF